MGAVVYILINAFAIFVASQVLMGVHVQDFLTAIIIAVILGVINTFLKPIILLLTLPLTILTFGLFAVVINALLILVVTWIVPGFQVDGFWWAVIFSIVISLVSSFLNMLTKEK